MKNIMRSNNQKLKFSSAFLGMEKNLIALESTFTDRIQASQFANYLALNALSLELGMKSFIIIENDVQKDHNLKTLFEKLPNDVKRCFYINEGINETHTLVLLEELKNTFEECRYVEYGNSKTDKKVLDIMLLNMSVGRDNGFIDFKEIADKSDHFNLMLKLRDNLRKYSNFLFQTFLTEISKIKDFDKLTYDEKLKINCEIYEKAQQELFLNIKQII
jgi:hypothetical protein